MDSLIRALIIFFFLMLVFRLSGKRTLQEVTIFDFVLLLIISESVQQALVVDDFSLTNGIVLISAYVGLDIGLSLIKRNQKVEQILDGQALVVVEHGKPLKQRMKKSRVDEGDILEAARQQHGLERMEQVKFAVLEKNGQINIIPQEQKK